MASHCWRPDSLLTVLMRPWCCSMAAEGRPRAYYRFRRTILLGFSQGACLALEYAARNPDRYGGIIGLSGGLIGPKGVPRNYSGSLAGTPVFLGCSDTDPHIPKERVAESERVFRLLGADVTTRLYPNMGHGVSHDEVNIVRKMMNEIVKS
jgi:phospholipase/carboxylesterase